MFLRLSFAFGLVSAIGASQVITTVVGTNFIFPSSPYPAISAPLGRVSGVAVDGNGSVYVADVDNNLVMRISRSGVLTVVAGNGVAGFSGDGGPATSAALALDKIFGSEIALDSAGNLYIADTYNGRIRTVSGGIITTVAGNGGVGYGGDGGSASSATLNFPEGVAVDSAGNIYITDTDNRRVRKVSGGIITTVVGNGTQGSSGDGGPGTSATLSVPIGITTDPAGNIYIADYGSQRIRRITGGTITTIAGNGVSGFTGDGGPAANASLAQPSGVVLDSAGNVYIADTGNSRIRKVTGALINTIQAGLHLAFLATADLREARCSTGQNPSRSIRRAASISPTRGTVGSAELRPE